jgi:hypothetical protein
MTARRARGFMRGGFSLGLGGQSRSVILTGQKTQKSWVFFVTSIFTFVTTEIAVAHMFVSFDED